MGGVLIMAITAITSISTRYILLNEGESLTRVRTGTLTAATYPGQWLIYVAASDTWTQLASGTAAHKIQALSVGQVGVLGYYKRVNETTGALLAITDQYDPANAWDYEVPIITSGIVACYITDPSATVAVGSLYMASATGGSAAYFALENVDSGGYYGTAIKSVPVGRLASQAKTGDTKAIMAIGLQMAEPIWANGPNRGAV